MLFSWQILVAISVITYSLVVLLQRVILHAQPKPIAYAIFSQFLCASFLLIFGLVTGQFQAFEWSSVWVNLVIMAVLYAAGNIFGFSALHLTEASKFTVLFATRGLVTVFGAAVLLQERVGWEQLAGAGLIFAGVVCSSWTAKRLVLQKGDYLALIAAGFFGLANVNDRFVLQHVPVYTYVTLSFLLPPVVIALLKWSELQYIKTFFNWSLVGKSLLLNFFCAVASFTFFAALAVTQNTAQVAMSSLTSVIVIVGLSILFLKERTQLWQKILGAFLAFAGLVLL